MLLIYMAVLAIITAIGAKAAPKGEIISNYMSREQTTCVKGFFAVIIVFSHMLSYVPLQSQGDYIFYRIIWLIGQFMVTMFFFYSGYGILESVKKRSDYFKGFFKNRFLKTLVHFDLAILLFYLLNMYLGQSHSVKKTLLAFTGWTSIGNSNWFIFGTLVLYLLTLIAFGIFRKKRTLAVIFTILLTIAFTVVLSQYKNGYWYNTLICYPLGMVYSLCKDKIDRLFAKRHAWYYISLILCVAVTAILPIVYQKSGLSKDIYNLVLYPIMSCTFSLAIVLATMKISTGNKVLYWLGINSFSIYILQRLPMRLLEHWGINGNTMLFSIIAIAVTMVIAPAFTALTNVIDKVLFGKKRPAVQANDTIPDKGCQ